MKDLIPRVTLLRIFMLLMVLVGFTLLAYRYWFGLGMATNMSDSLPWGWWKGFHMFCGIALAGGGFVLAGVVHIFRLHKFEPFVLQTYDLREASPALHGDLTLVDCETGDTREVTVSKSLLEAYEREHEKYCKELEAYCTKYAMPFFRTHTSIPFDELDSRSSSWALSPSMSCSTARNTLPRSSSTWRKKRATSRNNLGT